MVLREQTYTAEEFWQIARSTENETLRLELEDGVIKGKDVSLCVLRASPENRKFGSKQVAQNAIFIARRVFIHEQLCGSVF